MVNTTYPPTVGVEKQGAKLEELPDFLTVYQLAELLQMSVNTTRSLLHSGEIPAVKIRRKWRISKAQLTAHLGIGSQGQEESREWEEKQGKSHNCDECIPSLTLASTTINPEK